MSGAQAPWIRSLDRGGGHGRQLLAACGLAAVALTVPAFVLVPPAPAVDASVQAVVSYYQRVGTPFLVYGWLIGLSVPLMLAHVAGVATWLHEQCGLRTLSLLYAVTGVTSHTIQLALLAAYQAVQVAAAESDPSTAALSDLASVGFAFYAIAEGGRLSVAATVILGTRFLPRWLGFLAWGNVVLCLIGSLGAFGSGPLAAGRLTTVAWYLAFLLIFTVANVYLLLPRRSWAP